jgi:hypothetical protein
LRRAACQGQLRKNHQIAAFPLGPIDQIAYLPAVRCEGADGWIYLGQGDLHGQLLASSASRVQPACFEPLKQRFKTLRFFMDPITTLL